VTVTSACELDSSDRHKVTHQFPEKKINYEVDPDLLVGIKITGADFSYELSLNHNLTGALEHLSSI